MLVWVLGLEIKVYVDYSEFGRGSFLFLEYEVLLNKIFIGDCVVWVWGKYL